MLNFECLMLNESGVKVQAAVNLLEFKIKNSTFKMD